MTTLLSSPISDQRLHDPSARARKKILLSWSSGKDSAWSLHVLRQRQEYEIAGLLTTINSAFDRVAMHSSRRSLVEMQAAAAGLPLIAVPLPWPCSNEEYERAMKTVCDQAVAEGVQGIAFGDLFLETSGLIANGNCRNTGLEPLFPLWKIPTDVLARDMIRGGLRARLVCVDPRKLAPEFAGREFDDQLLRDFPAGVDPCGENGEFHSFVYAGPMFRRPIPIQSGEHVQRDGFCFADLTPAH